MPKMVKNQKMSACICGYSQDYSQDITGAGIVKEVVKAKPLVKEMVVEGASDSRLPTANVECQKCGHKKAFFWTKQTRAGDEPETKFYKCEKCARTWRDYS